MAESIGGNFGADIVQQFLARADAQREAQDADAHQDDRVDDEAQHAIARKAAEKKQQANTREQHHVDQHQQVSAQSQNHKRWQQLAQGSKGPELMRMAGSPQLQQKLNDKLRQMFVDQADAQPATAKQAAATLAEAASRPGFAQGAPTTRAVGELATKLLQRPDVHDNVRQAMAHPFMNSPNGDALAKQGLLRFASQAKEGGVTVKAGADVLETLRQTREPGKGQRATMDMIERGPHNVEGVSNVDKFVKTEPMRNMASKAALGEAVAVLAKGNGSSGLSDSLVKVADSKAFQSLDWRERGQLYSTIGQGRTADLRGIADQALAALRSNRFPKGERQVNQYLSGLSRQIKTGESKGDNKALLREARKGSGPPRPPQLLSLTGLSEEDQDHARRQNRSAVTAYYSKVAVHQDKTERELKKAKSSLAANKIAGVRPPEEPDLQALTVRPELRERVKAALKDVTGAPLRSLAERTTQLKALSAQFQGKEPLTTDETTYVLGKVGQAIAETRATDLGMQKQRRARQLRGEPEPPRRAQAADRRPQGPQAPYIKLAGRAGPLGSGAAQPARGQSRAATAQAGAQAQPSGSPGRASLADATRLASAPALAGSGAEAVTNRFARGAAASPQTRQDVRNIMAQLDPNMPRAERAQRAADIIGQQAAERSRALATLVMAEILHDEAPEGRAPATAGRAAGQASQVATGQTDAWGIKRTAERDLGAHRNFQAVKPPNAADQEKNSPAAAAEAGPAEPSRAKRRQVAKETATIAPLSELYGKAFKEMNGAERAIFKNLGWKAESWQNRQQMVPATYQKPFAELSDAQRQSVRLLGLSSVEWDAEAARLRQG